MIEYIITDNPDEGDVDRLLTKLKEYNLARIETDKVVPLAIFAKDKGVLIGGIVGETHGNWLEVSYLIVDDNHRGKDVGTKLLNDAENEGRNRGCKFSFLYTFGFQARDFYIKQGYKEISTLDDYPLTGKLHYLLKQL